MNRSTQTVMATLIGGIVSSQVKHWFRYDMSADEVAALIAAFPLAWHALTSSAQWVWKTFQSYFPPKAPIVSVQLPAASS